MNKDSVDLFDRAILSSGVINKVWSCVTPEQQKKRVALTLKQLKCPENQTKEEVLQYLMSMEVSEYRRILRDPVDAIENDPRPVNTFMQNPKNLIPLKRKPILIGLTAEEGNVFPLVILADKFEEVTLTKLVFHKLIRYIFRKPNR